MALALVLRNASKSNGRYAGLVKSARLTPLKTYSTIVAAQRNALTKPVNFVKNVAPTTRNISVSAPRLAAGGLSASSVWTIERALALGLLGIIPAAFMYPSQTLDALLAVSVTLHAHWGIEALVIDYIRPSVFGNIIPKVTHASLYLVSIAVLGGLFYMIYNDIGIAKSIKKFWAVKGV